MKKSISIFSILIMKNFIIFAMDADQKPVQSVPSDAILSPSGIASPSSLAEQVFQKHIDVLSKQIQLSTTQRQIQLLCEMKMLARNPATKEYALQQALSLRTAEKGVLETYDRKCFTKVEFWASEREKIKIATFWTLHTIEYLKSLKDLNNYEASALNTRKLADKQDWTREKLIEHMTMGWELMHTLDLARIERDSHDPAMMLSQEVIAAAMAPPEGKNKRGSGTFSVRKFRSGSLNNSGNTSPTGNSTKQ